MTVPLIFCGIVHMYLTNHVRNWPGYMSSLKRNDHPLTNSVIILFQVINLHATDTTVLYSLLSFVTNQSSKLNVSTYPLPQ